MSSASWMGELPTILQASRRAGRERQAARYEQALAQTRVTGATLYVDRSRFAGRRPAQGPAWLEERAKPTANPRQVTPQSTANLAEMEKQTHRRVPRPGRWPAARCGPWPRRGRVKRSCHNRSPADHGARWRGPSTVMRQRTARFPPTAATPAAPGPFGRPGAVLSDQGVGQHDELAHDGARRVEPTDLRPRPAVDDGTLTRERHRLACGSPSRAPGRRPGAVTLGFSDRCPAPDGDGDLRFRATRGGRRDVQHGARRRGPGQFTRQRRPARFPPMLPRRRARAVRVTRGGPVRPGRWPARAACA